MRSAKKFIFNTTIAGMLFMALFILPACHQHKCVANGGGYKPPKPGRHHKSKSGLFPKSMKPKH